MDKYQKFLRKMALIPLLPALLILLFAELIGALLFNLDPVTIFVWFSAAFISYYGALAILSILGALVGVLIYLGTPAVVCLILAIAVLLGGTYLVMTKTNPVVDIMQILEDANIPDKYLSFLQKLGKDYTEELNQVQAMLDASAPDVKKVDTVIDTSNGKLTGSYNLTKSEDGSTVVEYTYEWYNEDTKAVETATGTLTLEANSKLTDKEIADNAFLTVISLSIKLNGEKLKNISVVSGTLSAKIKAFNTEEVLGVALESDVYVVITMSRDNITAIDLTYDSSDGKVSVSVGYTYLEEVTPETPDNGGETPTEPEDGGETPTEPEDGGETPTEPEDGGETPNEPEDGGETPTEPDDGGETPTEPEEETDTHKDAV